MRGEGPHAALRFALRLTGRALRIRVRGEVVGSLATSATGNGAIWGLVRGYGILCGPAGFAALRDNCSPFWFGS